METRVEAKVSTLQRAERSGRTQSLSTHELSQEFGLLEEIIFKATRNFQARMASFTLLSNQRIVPCSPSRKVVFAHQPNSASAREVSRQRRGWPSGFVASQRIAPSYPTSERICSSK